MSQSQQQLCFNTQQQRVCFSFTPSAQQSDAPITTQSILGSETAMILPDSYSLLFPELSRPTPLMGTPLRDSFGNPIGGPLQIPKVSWIG